MRQHNRIIPLSMLPPFRIYTPCISASCPFRPAPSPTTRSPRRQPRRRPCPRRTALYVVHRKYKATRTMTRGIQPTTLGCFFFLFPLVTPFHPDVVHISPHCTHPSVPSWIVIGSNVSDLACLAAVLDWSMRRAPSMRLCFVGFCPHCPCLPLRHWTTAQDYPLMYCVYRCSHFRASTLSSMYRIGPCHEPLRTLALLPLSHLPPPPILKLPS